MTSHGWTYGLARLGLGAVVCLAGLALLAVPATATKPRFTGIYEGCIFEGFLIRSDPSRLEHRRLPEQFADKWTMLEAKEVRFPVSDVNHVYADDFLKTPFVKGACDLGKHKTQVAYAWFMEAYGRLNRPQSGDPLAAITRSLALDPKACSAAVLMAFALEHAGRTDDARGQIAKARSMKCQLADKRWLYPDTKLPIDDRR
jgi:hypothetical protein